MINLESIKKRCEYPGGPSWRKLGAFIDHAQTDIPVLIAEVIKLRQTLVDLCNGKDVKIEAFVDTKDWKVISGTSE